MQDWNWFFSSLAQSTAAFVGLLGAFIITKIINNEQKFQENKDKIQTMVIYASNIKRKLDNRYFDWYNERIREQTLEEINRDDLLFEKSPVELFQEYDFSPFDKKDDVVEYIDTFKAKLSEGMHGLE